MHLEGIARSIESIMNLLQQMIISEEVKKDPSKTNEIVDTINTDSVSYGYKVMIRCSKVVLNLWNSMLF